MATFRVSPLMTLLGAIFFFASNVFAVAAVLGVDLGTEYIKAALVKPGSPLDVVLTKDSRRKETSAIVFKPSRNGPQPGEFPERGYGADAIALSARFPGEVYPNLKTILGLPTDSSIVQEYAARHPALQLQAHPVRGTAAFKSKAFTAEEEAWMVEELLAMQLQNIQKNAEIATGDGSAVRSVVITVPPFYTVDEKRAIQAAADLAGLKVLSLISDGLAVGLNYATTRQFPSISEGAKPEYHMVFDMGAGSTKATVLKFQSQTVKDASKFDKTVQEVQVVGAGWDRTLGGDALNNLIIDDMVKQFVESKSGQKVSATAEGVKAHGRAIAKLTNQVEKIRHVLSANQNTGGSFEGLYEDADFKYKISRTQFEEMVAEHVERISTTVNNALKVAGLDIADLDSIILHGGATRTPFVQKALENLVGSDKVRSNVNSDEAAVFGAGFRAAELSPSFRVKDIRISEGASYSTGLKRTIDDQEERQRLWSAISPQGVSKVLSFEDKKDFTATIYQQVGSDEKDVKTFTTKNLTATLESIKEKFPSCVESDIKFKIAMELSHESGEFQITKALVECMADATDNEGFVGGVKNLFGFGKKDKDQKDQKPLGEEESEGSEEAMKDDAAKSSTAAEEPAESSASSGAEAAASESAEAKADTKKKELVSIPVEITVENMGIPELTKSERVKAKDRIKAFAASDKLRLQREEALNQLEGFTYKVRDLLEDDRFVEATTDKVRAQLSELSSEISEWLYDGGAEASLDVLKAKLKSLQDLVKPAQKRITEAEQRPALISKLEGVLTQTETFISKLKEQIAEHDAWHKSASESPSPSSSSSTKVASEAPKGEFDGLEDEENAEDTARKMEDVIREKGPVPPLYTLEELSEVSELYESTLKWFNNLKPKQSVLGPTDDPVLRVKDLEIKARKLEQAGISLAMKGAKKVEKEAKKAKKAEKKQKKTQTSSADASQETVEFNAEDFLREQLKNQEGESPTEEQLEQLIQQLKENQKKTEKDGEKQPPHDEL